MDPRLAPEADERGGPGVEDLGGTPGTPDPPSACSYCGGSSFEPPEDNGRVSRVECADCGGTMVSHGGTWMPDLIGSPHNHPSQAADPASGGVGGVWPHTPQVQLRTNDLSSRTAVRRERLVHAPINDVVNFAEHDGDVNGEDYANSLAEHVKEHGIEEPLTLHVHPSGSRATLHDGNHRLRAAWVNGHTHVPLIVKQGPMGSMPGSPYKGEFDHLPDHYGSRTAGQADYCRHRHAGHCWLPRTDENSGGVALYTPQDRGVCPWTTPTMQQINCPVSAPGPMSGMSMAGRKDAKPKPLKRGLGPTHDPKTCPVCRQQDPGPVRHQGAPVPAPHPNPTGGTSWYHGTSFHPDDDWEYKDQHSHHTPTHPTLDGIPFGIGETKFHGDPGGRLKAPDRQQWSAGSNADYHWNTDLGTHFSSEHGVAAETFAESGKHVTSRVAHASLHMANPKHYADEHEFGADAVNWSHMQGHRFLPDHDRAHDHFCNGDDDKLTDHPSNTRKIDYNYVSDHLGRSEGHDREAISEIDQMGISRPHEHDLSNIDRYLSMHPDREKITQGFRQHLQEKGHDGVIYGNEQEGPHKHPCAIAFPDTHVHINKWEWQHPESEHHVPKPNRTEDWGQHQLLSADPREWPAKAASLIDPEWHFHLLATWRDVRAKAKRIRTEGGVNILSVLAEGITGHVNGDTGVYESQINYVPGSKKIGYWQCGCAWASYAWGRAPAFRRFEGRMCSHALALQYEAQSRGMFGRPVEEDVSRPEWLRDKVRVRHDRDTRDHDVRAASRQDNLDPDGVYPSDHGLDLERAPLHAFAVEAYAVQQDPADVLRVFLLAGIEHADARRLLDATLHNRAQLEVEVHGLADPGAGLEKNAVIGPEDGVWWHGTATGDLRGGSYGLHLGTHKAATQALTASIGHPAEGVWDGTRTYGETMLAGKKTLRERGIYPTGYSAMHAPDHDHLPTGDAGFQSGGKVPMDARPDIFPARIHGPMTNTPDRPHSDARANGMMKGMITRGKARRGFYYINTGEDDGSVSAVVPHHSHIERIGNNDSSHRRRQSAKNPEPTEPTHAGVVLKAADTGRILMIQRSHQDENDPAAGCWEFPGGGREPGDHTSLHSGIREFEEEVGQPFPLGGHVQHVWQSPNGVYQGHVVVVPHEKDAVDFSAGRRTVNPDDPDGDDHEQSVWWDPDHARKNPALRPECRSSPWSMIKAATLEVTADYAAADGLEDIGSDWRPKPPPRRPDNDQGENPGSTGWATGGDPPEWENASQNPQTMSMTMWSNLHDEPEPALPSTTADEEDVVEGPGERYRAQMTPEISDADSSVNPNSVHASTGVAGIVERFQATAAAQALQTGGPDVMDIASAAREHLAKGGGMQHTALKEFSSAEQMELISEGRGQSARNLGDLRIEGTHYEALAVAMAAEHSLTDPDDLFD